MALAQNEYVTTYTRVTEQLGGREVTLHRMMIGKTDDELITDTRDKLRSGRFLSATLVKERVTWRGKNGKRTRTVLSEVPITTEE